jgi:hypothetical protein
VALLACWGSVIFSMSIFIVIAFIVLPYSCNSLWTFLVTFDGYSVARFTVGSVSIFCTSIFIEIMQWLDLLASEASFCYRRVRHLCFLIKHKCLEPSSSDKLGRGLFYYTRDSCIVKEVF